MARLQIDLVSDLDARGFRDAGNELDKFGGAVKAAGAAIGIGLAAGAVKAVGAASDLAESTNAVGKVFEDSAKTIEAFGDVSAETVGLSKKAFQTLATSTGSTLKNLGLDTESAADSTIVLAKRAADMASVFNTDVETALNAINSGLRGEAEPLRAFGVSLSDATVKAQALEMGLYSGTGALDANAKAQATMALILEQSNSVAGDFADTADGMANGQRILTASLEDTTAELGSALLPIVEDGVGLLRKFADWAAENTTTVKILVIALAAFAATTLAVNAATTAFAAIQAVVKAATVAWTGVQWLLNAALTANPIGIVVVAIAALIAGIVLAYQKSDEFRAIVDAVGRVLVDVLKFAIDWVVGGYKLLWDIIKKVADVLSGVFTFAVDAARRAFDLWLTPIRVALDLLGKLKDIAGKVGGALGALGKLNPFALPGGGGPSIPNVTPDVLARHGMTPSSAGGPSTGSLTVNVNVSGLGTGNPYVLGRQIARTVNRAALVSGNLGDKL